MMEKSGAGALFAPNSIGATFTENGWLGL